MFDFIGDLFSAGADLIGGVVGGIGDVVGGLFGGGESGGGIFGLGLDIFGGGGDSIFDSPVIGHMIGAVGQQLMAPTAEERAEEAAAIIRAQREAEQEAIRANYGLPAEAPTGGEGLPYTPPRANGLMTPRTRSSEAYAY